MSYCKRCRERVTQEEVDEGEHYCNGNLITIDRSFLTSMLVGSLTDSAILGGLIGGDPIGGLLGDLLDGDLMD